jgi:hypothetical protein
MEQSTITYNIGEIINERKTRGRQGDVSHVLTKHEIIINIGTGGDVFRCPIYTLLFPVMFIKRTKIVKIINNYMFNANYKLW